MFNILRKFRRKRIDNIIEAIENPNCDFNIGVQWHPEYLDDLNSKKIFDCFIETIKKLPNN